MADFSARKLQSEDGRVVRVVTSQEELDELKDQGGWKAVTKSGSTTDREALASGAEGQRRARASSTTEGQERNTGSTTPSSTS